MPHATPATKPSTSPALGAEPSILCAYSRTLAQVLVGLGASPTTGRPTRQNSGESGPGAPANTAHAHEPLQHLLDQFDAAARATGVASLGVRFGLHVRPGTFGALGYAAMNADTVAGSLTSMSQFGQTVIRVGCPAVTTQISSAGFSIEWNASHTPIAEHPQLAESMIASIFHFGLWISGNPKPTGRVEFRHAAPADTRLHQQLFPNGVVFGASHSRIVLPLERLATSLPQADPQLHDQMTSQLATALDWTTGQQALHQQLRPIIQALLPEGRACLTAVADRMGASVRTLQRRLETEGIAFRQLVDQVRRELTDKHMADPRLSLVEVAAMVGFAEQSSFSRAYRQWTGHAPSFDRRRTE